MNLELRPLQEKAIAAVQQAFRDGYKRVMLQAPCGFGKCHGVDTKILMSDGSIKLVQNVEVGDKLLAPDGTARNVLSLGRGRENMYRVEPVKGDSYIVNESHILSLRKHGEDGMILSNGRHIPRNSDLVTLTVKEFLDANKTVQTNLKGWRASAVNFPDATQDSHLIPPYILGVWLGDGLSREPAITKPQTKMLDEWIAYVYSLGMKITVDNCGGRCPTHHARNKTGRGKNQITEALRSLNLIQNKHIPQSYKTASIEDRLQLLAGLIDSNGHQTRGCYDWLSKHEVLARDFAFVVRSVGLSCYVSKCKKSIKSRNFVGEYWRCIVSGDTTRIPARDKPADARLINKRNLIHGISIEPIGEGDYYGFELNGDHLYLLDDFTVCHNTELATAMLQKTYANMKRGAFICDRLSLIEQTGERFDKYKLPFGVMQSQHWRTRPYERIQLCSIQTIAKKKWPEVELLMADEAHVMPKALAERIDKQDCYVVGLSATPFTKGLGQHFDIVINAATTNELIEMGWLVPYRVFAVAEPDLIDVKIVGGEWDEKQLESKVLPVVGDCVAEYQKLGEGKKFICFAVSILHAAELKRQFAEAGIITELYTYKESAEEKIEAVNEFRKPDSYIRGLISIESLTRGFDVSDIEVLILARPLRNAIAVHIQMMGRILRIHDNTFEHYKYYRSQQDGVQGNNTVEIGQLSREYGSSCYGVEVRDSEENAVHSLECNKPILFNKEGTYLSTIDESREGKGSDWKLFNSNNTKKILQCSSLGSIGMARDKHDQESSESQGWKQAEQPIGQFGVGDKFGKHETRTRAWIIPGYQRGAPRDEQVNKNSSDGNKNGIEKLSLWIIDETGTKVRSADNNNIRDKSWAVLGACFIAESPEEVESLAKRLSDMHKGSEALLVCSQAEDTGLAMRINGAKRIKKIATILDHSGNCARFWNQVADFFENGISVLDDGKKKSKEEVEKAKPKDKEAAKCPKCSMIHESKICPGCGFEYIRASGVLHIAGELSEIKGSKSFSMAEKQQFYSELLTYSTSKGYADGWAANHYRQKFSVWPNQMKRELKPLSQETSNFIKSRIIAYAKAKAKAAT